MNVNKATGEVSDEIDFATFLATVRPRTADELGEKLRSVVRAVKDTGKVGSVTLTVQIKPLDGDVSIMQVFDQIKVNIPEHDRKGSLAYPDESDNLTRSDPNSLPLFQDESDIKSPPTTPAHEDVKEPPQS